jgi:hypothetical protein
MYSIPSHVRALILATAAIVSLSVLNQANAATAEDLDKDSRQALQTLYKTEPLAEHMSRTANPCLTLAL